MLGRGAIRAVPGDAQLATVRDTQASAEVAERQDVPHPRIESEAVRDYLTHLAVRQRVGEEAFHPGRVAALRSIGVVPGSDAESKLFERRQRIRPALLIHDGTGWVPMPVGSLEEVDEVDPAAPSG